MNNGARTQEEQGFEEGMCEQVEHARPWTIHLTGYAQTHKHIAKLTDRGEGEHALEVGLGEGSECGIERRNRTHPGHHLKCSGVSSCKKRIGTSDHIDTRSHH